MFQKIVGSMAKIQSRFFLCQLQNSKKKSRGRRFSLEDKVLALALFKQCGSGYRLLSKIFALPSRKTIMKLLNRIPVRPGICEPIFDILKVEVKQFKNPLDKYCVLIFDEMSLKSAFQWNMFDASVEGFEDFGTTVYTEDGALTLDKEAVQTAKFIEFMDNLFDSVNGSLLSNPLKPLKEPIDVGFDKISPRRFNQDPLENFFGQIRQRGMRYTNPTCAAFTPLYKSLLVKDLTSSHSLGASCEDDESEILVTLQRFVSQGLPEDEEETCRIEFNLSACKLPEKLTVTESQVLKYVCGYLLKKAQTVYKDCTCAQAILEVGNLQEEDSDLFLRLKQFKNAKLVYLKSEKNVLRSTFYENYDESIRFCLQRFGWLEPSSGLHFLMGAILDLTKFEKNFFLRKGQI
ncbi:hypothetical protein NQ315_014688 [Exocentrus adspersus]|uniref:Transposable element P transposase n=1 Tax=Exocentrus adspersus TaxID=1586481 RepID=A0AAV8VQR7_9CUCU|nr:hypothetical protein NQ315_014688 [Exocentrus adspersus]